MTRQDEPTDQIGILTGTCLRCTAREYGTGRWDKADCSSSAVTHCWVAVVNKRVQTAPDGVRAAIATAMSLPAPKQPPTAAWLAFGFGCMLFGVLAGYALAKSGWLS